MGPPVRELPLDGCLRADDAVRYKKGIYEYLLGGKQKPQLIDVRIFDAKQKATKYEQQTKVAQAAGVSNCPTCASRSDNNKTRIYKLSEMDADHVTAWSKGGATDLSNPRCRARRITAPRAIGSLWL